MKQSNLPWILLFGGWGAAVALIGGIVGYLWLAADSIEAELKEQRRGHDQGQPKRRNIELADAPRREEKRLAQDAQPAGEGSDEDLKASLSRSFGTPKDAKIETTETAAAQPNQIEQSENEAGAPAVGVELHPHPDLKLIEETEAGSLPKIDEEGREPWRVYSRPFNRKDVRARIAVVISHLGLSPTQHRMRLPNCFRDHPRFRALCPEPRRWVSRPG